MPPLLVFRPSFWLMVRPFLKGTASLGVFLAVLGVIRGQLRHDDLTALIALGAVWFSIPFLAALVFATPAFLYEYFRAPVVKPDGISSLDTLQRRRHVPWNKINAAKLQSPGGYPELNLSVNGSRWKVRVPLYMRERAAFEQLLRSYAGTEHPLVRALRGEA
jgi:hypothetical protein